MTLTTTPRTTTPAVATGASQTVPFAFRAFAADQIAVYLRNTTTGALTTAALNSEYTVLLNADQGINPGGSITLTATAGLEIFIKGATSISQTSTLANQGGVWPVVVEAAVDKLTAVTQEMREDLDRAITTPLGSSLTADDLRDALLSAASAIEDNESLISDLPVGSAHWLRHQQIDNSLLAINTLLGITSPTPAPTPVPTPAPAGDTFDFTPGTLPAGCTLARASSGYRRTNTVGAVNLEAIDAARFDHSAAGGLYGLLVEPTAVNLCPYGLSPGGTGWTTIGTAPTRTTGRTDPDGGTNAVRLQMSAANSGYQLSLSGLTSGAASQAPIWMKSNSAGAHNVFIRDIATNAWEIQSVPPGTWTRFFKAGAAPGTTFNITIVAESAGCDIDVWGQSFFQEHWEEPTDYPSSTASTTTRSPDILTFTGLTDGTQDIEIDYVEDATGGTTIKRTITGVTVAGNTYELDPDDYVHPYARVSEIRFIPTGTGSSPTPAPTPAPTPTPAPASTIFRAQMESFNEGYPIAAQNVLPLGNDGDFKTCGGFVTNEGGGTPGYVNFWFEFNPEDRGGGDYAYPSAPNTTVDFMYLRMYRKRGSDPWELVKEASSIGAFWWWNWFDRRGYDINGYPDEVRYASTGITGGFTTPINEYLDPTHPVHHADLPNPYVAYQAGDRISIQAQVRKRLIDPNGTDDRANVKLLIHLGSDRSSNGSSRDGVYMQGSYYRVPDDGSTLLITETNITVNKACSGCGAGGGDCYDYPGVFTGAQLDADPPPIPVLA